MADLKQQQILASALRRYEALQRDECIDPFVLESRPYPKQYGVLEDIAKYNIRAVVAANQTGKSAIGGREVSWIFQENNPYFKRPKEWGDGPLLILVLGQVGESNETHLWNLKIKPFIDPKVCREVRSGNALQRVIHRDNGNTIIFISHHNANEARKTAQGYPAHYVWLDEMPNSVSLIAELQTRILAKNAKLLITFTPLLKNIEIKNMIEGLTPPFGKKYTFHMLDNPIYKGREQQTLEQYKDYPENERRARLFGEWFSGSQAVYEFDPDHQTEKLPEGYSKSWDHVESVDPAASSKMGYLLLAQSPKSGSWITAKAKYITGAAASDLLPQVLAEGMGCNIVRRICDPHEVWYLKEAIKPPWNLNYMGVHKKNERKSELIKNLQLAITKKKTIACSHCIELIQEAISCQWSETIENKIVNASRYHLLDCWQYAVDNLPANKVIYKPLHPNPRVNFDMELRGQNDKRKKREFKIKSSRRSKWRSRLHG